MKRLRGNLSYANVISTLCLFLLLGGGTAFAASQLAKNSVGAKQIKRGAITPAKLAAATKSQLKGDIGATGLTGAAGPPGVSGAAGATKVVVRLGAEGEPSEAFCNPGEVAVGGGGQTPGLEEALFASRPITAEGKAGEVPTGWFAGAESPAGEQRPVVAYVVCASP
jgi:hypothetical protein